MHERSLRDMCIDQNPEFERKLMNFAVIKRVSGLKSGIISSLGMFCVLTSVALAQVQVEILDTVKISESHYY